MTTNDHNLVKKVQKANCETSLVTLIKRHSALCYDIYKKYSPALVASGLCVNEISKDKDFIVYKSALSFNPSKKVKFSTWLGNQVRYSCLNAINSNKLIPTEDEQLDYFLSTRSTAATHQSDASTSKDEVEYVFNILQQLKDKRVKKVFKLRYFGGEGNKKMPWALIAKELKISTQTAINLHERGKQILKKKSRCKNYMDNI